MQMMVIDGDDGDDGDDDDDDGDDICGGDAKLACGDVYLMCICLCIY